MTSSGNLKIKFDRREFVVTAEIAPRLTADPAEIDRILADGAARAREIASPVMDTVKDIVGLLRT